MDRQEPLPLLHYSIITSIYILISFPNQCHLKCWIRSCPCFLALLPLLSIDCDPFILFHLTRISIIFVLILHPHLLLNPRFSISFFLCRERIYLSLFQITDGRDISKGEDHPQFCCTSSFNLVLFYTFPFLSPCAIIIAWIGIKNFLLSGMATMCFNWLSWINFFAQNFCL